MAETQLETEAVAFMRKRAPPSASPDDLAAAHERDPVAPPGKASDLGLRNPRNHGSGQRTGLSHRRRRRRRLGSFCQDQRRQGRLGLHDLGDGLRREGLRVRREALPQNLGVPQLEYERFRRRSHNVDRPARCSSAISIKHARSTNEKSQAGAAPSDCCVTPPTTKRLAAA